MIMARAGRAWHVIVDHYRTPRVLGLDLMRITASLSIVVYHGNSIGALGKNWLSALIRADGYLAVDVFFVLSGWLLTRQVLRMRNSFRTWRDFATTFWIRRWARTLPPYWVVLLIVFVLGPHLNRLAVPHSLSAWDLFRHAFFLQTTLPPNMYSVTWSLVTEEYFYLLLPFVVLLAFKLRSWKSVVALGLAGLLLPTTGRGLMLLYTGDWVGTFTSPPVRFEGLVVGGLLAAASLRPWWQTRVVPRQGWLFAAACPAILVVLFSGITESWGFRVFGVLAFNLLLGLVLPFLSQLRWSAGTPVVLVMSTAYLSELTYPLYLLHPIAPRLPFVQLHGPVRLLNATLTAALLLLVATALHLGIERPFLAWRDRRMAREGTQAARSGAVSPAVVQAWKEPAPASGSVAATPSPASTSPRTAAAPPPASTPNRHEAPGQPTPDLAKAG